MQIDREVIEGVKRLIPAAHHDNSPPKTDHEHLRWMLDQISSGVVRDDKAHRWLGFVQGVLATRGFLKVDAERDRTRPHFVRGSADGRRIHGEDQ